MEKQFFTACLNFTSYDLYLLQMLYLFYRITFKTDGFKIPCHCDKGFLGLPINCNNDCNYQKGFSLTVRPKSSCPEYDSHFNRGEKACQKKNP